jgi:hypothetical protein
MPEPILSEFQVVRRSRRRVAGATTTKPPALGTGMGTCANREHVLVDVNNAMDSAQLGSSVILLGTTLFFFFNTGNVPGGAIPTGASISSRLLIDPYRFVKKRIPVLPFFEQVGMHTCTNMKALGLVLGFPQPQPNTHVCMHAHEK